MIPTDFRPITRSRGFAANRRVAAWIRPRIKPKSSAVDAEDMCRFFLPEFELLVLVPGKKINYE